MDEAVSADRMTVQCIQCNCTFEVSLPEHHVSSPTLSRGESGNVIRSTWRSIKHSKDSLPSPIKIVNQNRRSRASSPTSPAFAFPVSSDAATLKTQVKNLLRQLETMSARLLEAADVQADLEDDRMAAHHELEGERKRSKQLEARLKQLEGDDGQEKKLSAFTLWNFSSEDNAKKQSNGLRVSRRLSEGIKNGFGRSESVDTHLRSPSFFNRRTSGTHSDNDVTMNSSAASSTMNVVSPRQSADVQSLEQENAALREKNANMEAELEDLSQSLFEEANQMVSTERMKQAALATRVAELEARLQDVLAANEASMTPPPAEPAVESLKTEAPATLERKASGTSTRSTSRGKGKTEQNHANLEAEFAAVQEMLRQED